MQFKYINFFGYTKLINELLTAHCFFYKQNLNSFPHYLITQNSLSLANLL